jgi:hypothetical protein
VKAAIPVFGIVAVSIDVQRIDVARIGQGAYR